MTTKSPLEQAREHTTELITPCMTYSESGQLTGGGPCAEFVRLLSEKSRAEGRLAGMESGAEINRKTIAAMDKQFAEILAENEKLRAALTAAGIPSQARLDDKGPPLRITVERAREIMGMMEP